MVQRAQVHTSIVPPTSGAPCELRPSAASAGRRSGLAAVSWNSWQKCTVGLLHGKGSRGEGREGEQEGEGGKQEGEVGKQKGEGGVG